MSSIPAVFLLEPVLSNPEYIVSAGADTRVLWGNLLDLVNAVACIGTAVVLFPVVKRQNEAAALGLVTVRVGGLAGRQGLRALTNHRRGGHADSCVGGTARHRFATPFG